MVGRWMINMGTPLSLWKVRLLGVQLDDELLLDRLVDLFTLRDDAHGDAKATVAGLEPTGDGAVEHVQVALHVEVLAGHVLQGDDFAGANAVRRDVDALAVDSHVTVTNELAGLGA